MIERSMMSLISWLFETQEIRSVLGSVLSDNPYAMIVNRAVGFTYSGSKRQELDDGRLSRDIVLTRGEWEELRLKWWDHSRSSE